MTMMSGATVRGWPCWHGGGVVGGGSARGTNQMLACCCPCVGFSRSPNCSKSCNAMRNSPAPRTPRRSTPSTHALRRWVQCWAARASPSPPDLRAGKRRANERAGERLGSHSLRASSCGEALQVMLAGGGAAPSPTRAAGFNCAESFIAVAHAVVTTPSGSRKSRDERGHGCTRSEREQAPWHLDAGCCGGPAGLGDEACARPVGERRGSVDHTTKR
jgi:hypothetical protein